MADKMGPMVDALLKLRDRRDAARDKAEELGRQYSEAEGALMGALRSEELDQARGRLATFSVSKTTIPEVEDWAAVQAWVRRRNAFEMLHKRITVTAWRERLDSKILVPGTRAEQIWTPHLTARKL